jgi:UDP-N-acetylglucosamine 2-epimerase (non-hydrolysing)
MVLVGTKAQFIKTAPILRDLDSRRVPYRLVYTGQHSETFDLLETAFGTRQPDDVLVPDCEASTHGGFIKWCWHYWLAVARRIHSGAWRGTRIGLVHGDTASTLFGAIAARMAGGHVAHVEAGLRSPRLLEPFPEEIIRRLVSRLSSFHFVPDAQAEANLHGVHGEIINTGGNTLRDALSMSLGRMGALPAEGGSGGYVLVSIHRSENLSRRYDFDLLMEEVVIAAEQMHPATREKIKASGWLPRLQRELRLELLERMDYPDFVRLLIGSCCLLTDGGSNQEEAAMLGLPTLLLRRATERSDGLGDNVVLSGLKREVIKAFISVHLNQRWPLRLVGGNSPTSRLVDALERAMSSAS